MWDYYKVNLKLIRDMLGTCPEASIYKAHIIEKSKKLIQKANSLNKKIVKSIDKYKGSDISEKKEIDEMKGILRSYMAVMGKVIELPDSIDDLLVVAKGIDEEFNELVASGEQQKTTVFMKDKDGWPIISSHMILGNFKANLKTLVNNGDKSILSTKVSIGEVFALDVKVIEEFLRPSMDIIKDENGDRQLLERPIVFEQKGVRTSAIASSEQLPEGSEFSFTLRVRQKSPVTYEALCSLLDLGKNQGIGQWRGSGGKGAYVYKIEKLDDYEESFGEWR